MSRTRTQSHHWLNNKQSVHNCPTSNHWRCLMFQLWTNYSMARKIGFPVAYCNFLATAPLPCLSQQSSSARRSRGLCGCTLACSRWTFWQLLSLQESWHLDHTAGTAKEVQNEMSAIQVSHMVAWCRRNLQPTVIGRWQQHVQGKQHVS